MQAISTFEDLLQRAATPDGTGIYSAEYNISTLNPEPCTLNPEPRTLNHEP